MKFPFWLKLVALFIISLSIASSCTSWDRNSTSVSKPASGITLGFSAWPGWFPWQVAQEAEIFANKQVNVELKWFDGYLDSINALIARQLSANSQTLNDTIAPVAAGADLVVVLVNDNSTGNDKIIVREGINTISDLQGKKVAAEEGTVDHFLLLLGLKKAGLSQKDIQFVPLETGKAASAFVGGQVDAVGVFAPFTTQALKRPGSKELFSSKEFPGAISDHLVFDRQFLTQHEELVQKVVDSWFTTLDYIEKNRATAYDILAKRANVSVEEYKEYDAGTKIFTVEENLKAFAAGNDMTSLPYAAKEIANFLVESGLAKEVPDLSKVFDARFVKAYAAKSKQS